MDARVVVSDTDFTVLVGSPAPGQALVIDGDAARLAKTDVFDVACNGQDLLWVWVLAEDTSTPKEELTILCDAC